MVHDKFCDEAENFDDGWVCICDIIAEVRADECEQAAQRVAAIEPFNTHWVAQHEAVDAAASGGEQA